MIGVNALFVKASLTFSNVLLSFSLNIVLLSRQWLTFFPNNLTYFKLAGMKVNIRRQLPASPWTERTKHLHLINGVLSRLEPSPGIEVKLDRDANSTLSSVKL